MAHLLVPCFFISKISLAVHHIVQLLIIALVKNLLSNLFVLTPAPQVQTVLNTSRQEYLGPNADVYFYDQSTGKILAHINNITSFDYGCTQVVIDRNITSTGAIRLRSGTIHPPII